MSQLTSQRAGCQPVMIYREGRPRPVASGPSAMPAGGPGCSSAQGRGQRELVLAAVGELARALLSGQQPHDVLHLIAAQARRGTMAALVLVGSSTDGELLAVDSAVGPDSDRLRGQCIRLAPVPVAGSIREVNATLDSADLADPSGLALPLGGTPGGARRILVVLGLPAAGRWAAARALRVFAESAAQALELADERAAVERELLCRTATARQEASRST